MTYVVQGIVPDEPVHVPGKPSIRIALFDTNGDSVIGGGGGSTILRKFTAAALTIPDGTSQVLDTISFTLEEEALCSFYLAADHSDPPSSHQMSVKIDTDTVVTDTGNNTSGFSRYFLGYTNNMVPQMAGAGATSADLQKNLGQGISRIMAAGAHTFTHRSSRTGAGGSTQNRLLVVKIESAAIETAA